MTRIPCHSISTFFTTSVRAGNDAANKIREKVLENITNPPAEYLQDTDYGQLWQHVHNEWNTIISKIIDRRLYSTVELQILAGRGNNHDGNLICHSKPLDRIDRIVKIEFKYGGKSICSIPQFLSLQTNQPTLKMFDEPYDIFYYNHYIDLYIACDPLGITEPKPPLEIYLKCVRSTDYNIHPFFSQLKEREPTAKLNKNKVVNDSIRDYLHQYAHSIDTTQLTQKIIQTQQDKIYLLWSNQKFHLDEIHINSIRDIEFAAIGDKGNVIQLSAGIGIHRLTFHMLLRWRNHKGILNPAWQISMKRCIINDTDTTT
jgi:hypothetical protein